MSKATAQIREGDSVRLKRGHWSMTVVEFEGEGVNCVWGSGPRQQTAWVALACLENARHSSTRTRSSDRAAAGSLGQKLVQKLGSARFLSTDDDAHGQI